MRYVIFTFLIIFAYLMPVKTTAQNIPYTAPGNHNPLLPGYFADPTVKKFGDTYYIYATTDGNGGGLGPSQVWTSKDFVNWTMQDMNWPTTHNYWAPDVALGNDGKYYLYYCQPTVEIYGASSTTPVGPWTPLNADEKAVVPNYLVPKVITLDGQTFKDDDGKYYMTWGTWGIYPGYGCGIGLLNADMKSFAKTAQIPNTLAKDFFEGSFLFKRKGIYYLLYSSGFCEDGTYRVQYATSKTGPMEGYTFGKNNPILSTNADGTVHGPGHNSVLKIGDDYYIIYHRHNNPHSGGGYNRQVCADKMLFDADGNIERIVPTHTGIGFLGKNTIPQADLAYQKKVTASSAYEGYQPEFAVDDNNGTLWKPKDNSSNPAWLSIDLGKQTTVKSILTQFEYATWYYQYHIEYSADGKQWLLFADKSNNHWHGSPAVDEGNVKARYIRLTITGTEQPGLYKAVWNIKIYSEAHVATMPANLHQAPQVETYVQKGLLINLKTDDLKPGEIIHSWQNKGASGGEFRADGKAPVADFVAGKKAVVFTGGQSLQSTFNVPLSLAGNNSYTVLYWANIALTKDENPLLSWSNSGDQLSAATFGYGTNKDAGAARHNGFADIQFNKSSTLAGAWHQVAVTFDGTFEKVFVDGKLNNQENKMLFIKLAKQFTFGPPPGGASSFTGAIASLQVYDNPLSEKKIKQLYDHTDKELVSVYASTSQLPYGELQQWVNEGATGGEFQAVNGQPIVMDIGGRISLSLSGKETLRLNKPVHMSGDHTIAVSVFVPAVQNQQAIITLVSADVKPLETINTNPNLSAGKWHLLIHTVKGNTVSDYTDGQLQSSALMQPTDHPASLHIGSANLTTTGFKGGLAGISVYDYSLSDQQIKELFNNWTMSLHPPIDFALKYKHLPKPISPEMVTMEAATNTSNTGLQYLFMRSNGNLPVKESGWLDSPNFTDEGLLANQQYSYSFKVRDNLGNVSAVSPIASVSTNLAQFKIASDSFNAEKNYLLNGLTGSIWDGVIDTEDKQSAKAIIASDHTLKLESQGTNWDGNKPCGPFLYKVVKGNFTAEVEVSNVSGLAEKKVAGNNDVGLMIRADKPIGANEQLLQNGIFPAWSVGNILTNLLDGDRRQSNNQSAWNYDPYLQIQRDGNWFYLRTSKDNIHWTNLPGSPVLREDLENKEVQVGLYQCTYGPQQAYGMFKNFRLISIH